ncbi:MMPL family transporter [Demequina gelatinilytica]|uniref:MMPL family transporter n=1 Tax=Demequina gelatinilytica TaxID=1638980 RepID=UPI0007847D89|nr:MMPL family transporter [Demequina gelatinilytica]
MELGITGRIARAAAARPWLTITAWVLALAAAIVAAGGLGDALTQDDRVLVATDSDTAEQRDSQLRGADSATERETVVVSADTARWGDTEFTAAIDRVVAGLEALPDVESVTAPTAEQPFPVSEDGSAVLVTAEVQAGSDTVAQAVEDATDAAVSAGFTLRNVGPLTGELAFDSMAEDTLVRGEAIGIGVALVILVVVFGALVAAGLPLMIAIVSIISAVGATAIVGQAVELSFFIVNMITMMGLALGIDYSLVAVQRFREELAHGRTVKDAVAITGQTANRAILFSGVTVLISLVGMLVVPSTIMRSLGAGAMIVALMAVISALTLLPAVLRLLGHRVNRGRIPTAHPGREPRTWTAIARAVTARPAISATAGLAVLLTLALPLLSIRLTFPGFESLPEDNELRQGTEVLVDDFGMGQSTTMIAVDDAGGDAAAIDALASVVEQDPAFAETTVDWRAGTAFIDARGVFDSADPAADEAVERLREEIVPAALAGTGATAYVGGDQAEAVDFRDVIVDNVPLLLTIVLGASFLLLLVAFRSLAIPLTAIALNVVSAAAAFGLLVAVFQYGWGAELFGFAQVDGIAPWIPVFLFAVLFGLSMDYHVFLISRIKERHDATGDTRDAVVFGLSRTGSLITGAALIMVAVFLGFSLGDMAEFQEMGFGLAAAVIIDATVVRTILVPSLMTLLGERNWTLPRWLGWLPQVSVEGSAPEPPREKELARV